MEWKEKGAGFNGFFAGKIWFRVRRSSVNDGWRIDSYNYRIIPDEIGEFFPTLKEAKAKAEELLSEWLAKAGLMKIPSVCDGCVLYDKDKPCQTPDGGSCDKQKKKTVWCNTAQCPDWEKVERNGDKISVPGHCSCSTENPNYYLDCGFYS